MKRLFIFLALAFLYVVTAVAQENLQINAFFGAKYGQRKDATEVLLKGSKIRQYGLTLFRSLNFQPSAAELADLEGRVKADVRHATDRESATKGGHLYYGAFRLPPINKRQRFIFYRNNNLTSKPKPSVTLIYMEGNTTLKELKENFAE